MKKQNSLKLSVSSVVFSWLFLAAATSVFAQIGKIPNLSNSRDTEFCVTHIYKVESYYESAKPENKQRCETARKALWTAAVEVIGEDWKSDDILYLETNAKINQIVLDVDFAEKFKAGLPFADAMEWIKRKNAADEKYRARTVNNAYLAVYGRDAKPIEKLAWDARIKNKEVWYKTIFIENIKQMKQSSAARTEAINNAYNVSMGRDARPDEMKYWLPLIERASLVITANREYLYSSNGGKDLLETVDRAYKKLNPQWDGKPNFNYNNLLDNSKKYRYIYREMLKPDGKEH